MKRILLPALAFALGCGSAFAGANVFASSLKVEESNISFVLNDAANVVFNLYDAEGATIATVDLGAFEKGLNTVAIPAVEGVKAGEYAWGLKASAEAVTEPTVVTTPLTELLDIANATGIAVDNNFDSPYFGRVYVSSIEAVGKSGQRLGTGIYIFDAALTDVTEQGAVPYAGGETWSSKYGPHRLAVSPTGEVYMTDWSDAHSGIWVMDPANPGENFRSFFGEGTLDSSTGVFTIDEVTIHGSINDVTFGGKGEDTKMFTSDEDYDADGKTHVLRYDVGTSTAPWSVAPSYEYDRADGLLANGRQALAVDNNGGLFVSQYRWSTDSYPIITHFDADGKCDMYCTDSSIFPIGSRSAGNMALNHANDLIVVTSENYLYGVSVSWDENGVPSVAAKYTIDPGYGSAGYSAEFDLANNLYLTYQNDGGGVCVIAMPKEVNEFETPANDKITISTSGVAAIATESIPASYYNLQGMPVANPAKGQIYIKRTATKAEKVLVK